MDLSRFGPSDDPVAAIQALIVIVTPLVLRPQWIGIAGGLENAILIDILHLQSRHPLTLPGQFGRAAPFDGLTQDLLTPILPSIVPFSIDVTDLQGVTNKTTTIIRHDLTS